MSECGQVLKTSAAVGRITRIGLHHGGLRDEFKFAEWWELVGVVRLAPGEICINIPAALDHCLPFYSCHHPVTTRFLALSPIHRNFS